MTQRNKFLFISVSIIVLAATAWYSLSSAPDRENHAERSSIPASGNETASMQRTSAMSRPADSSAPGDPANRDLRIRQLPGRAFAVTDFGRVPSGTVDQVIAGLTPQALAGDATASYGIFLKLNECQNINRRASRGSAVQASPDVVSACLDLSAENEISASRWLTLAAEQGNMGARLLYAADSESALGGPAALLRDPDRTKEYKQKATGYLQDMVAQGSVDALLQLGNAYHAGVLLDEDLVTSRAYFEAARLADPSVVPVQQINTLDKALSAQQLSIARRKGSQIHDACCR